MSLADARQDELEERIDRVRDLHDFRFQVVELGASADEEQVAEIFVRINFEGVKLNQSDFILTLMSVHWEKGRRQLEDFSRARWIRGIPGPNPRNPFLDPSPDQLLRVAVAVAFRRARLQHVYNVLRGKDLETGKVTAERRRNSSIGSPQAHTKVLDLTSWHEFFQCITAAGFRSRKMITSDNALLYSYALWLIGRHDFGLSAMNSRPVIGTLVLHGAHHRPVLQLAGVTDGVRPGADRRLCRRVTARRSPRSSTGSSPRTSPATTGTSRCRTGSTRSSSRSPALFAYQAALNILDAELLFGDQRIRDLMDPAASPPGRSPGTICSRDPRRLGITDRRQVNAIANMAYRDVAGKKMGNTDAPHVYWPRITEAMDPEVLKRQFSGTRSGRLGTARLSRPSWNGAAS